MVLSLLVKTYWKAKEYIRNSGKGKINRNIAGIFITRVLSMILNFAIIRVTYDYLDKESYGIWLTILTISTWVNTFDIGLGNGLRNKLGEILVTKEYSKGKIYVSTSYAIFCVFVLLLYAGFSYISGYINWGNFFNTSYQLDAVLSSLLNIMILSFLLVLFFSLINQVAYAYQDSMIPSSVAFFTNLLICLSVVLLDLFYDSNLILLGSVFSAITVGGLITFSIILYYGKYKDVRPSIKHIQPKYIKSVYNLGIKFFVIQMAGLVIFSTDNIIIVKTLGPEYVIPYQLTYKLFSVFLIIQSIVLTPYWSAFTQAYIREDWNWIKKAMRFIISFTVLIILGVVVLSLFAKKSIYLWMGNVEGINFEMILLVAIYIIQIIWMNTFAYFLNGISKINVQLFCLLIGAVVNVPLSVFFIYNTSLGATGVVLGSVIALIPVTVLLPIQTYKLIKSNQKRIERSV